MTVNEISSCNPSFQRKWNCHCVIKKVTELSPLLQFHDIPFDATFRASICCSKVKKVLPEKSSIALVVVSDRACYVKTYEPQISSVMPI